MTGAGSAPLPDLGASARNGHSAATPFRVLRTSLVLPDGMSAKGADLPWIATAS